MHCALYYTYTHAFWLAPPYPKASICIRLRARGPYKTWTLDTGLNSILKCL